MEEEGCRSEKTEDGEVDGVDVVDPHSLGWFMTVLEIVKGVSLKVPVGYDVVVIRFEGGVISKSKRMGRCGRSNLVSVTVGKTRELVE